MKPRIAITLALAAALFACQAPAVTPVPGAPQQQPIALVGGTVHPVSGPEINNGTVLFENGKLKAVGRDVAIPAGTRRVNVEGKHVYPGLIDAYTQMGLVEIDAVRATNDRREVGGINPNARAEVAVNPDSEHLPVARSNGVLLTLSAPEGGTMSGTSALLQLDGWTWEDLTVRSPVGLHVNWPRMNVVRHWTVEESDKEQIKQRDEALKKLRETLADARAFLKARGNGRPAKNDSRLAALIPVLEGKVPLIIAADEAQQIQSTVAFAAREKVKLIIRGGYDAPECAELLKKHNVGVILSGVLRLPMRRDEPVDTPFTIPQRLREAGVPFCISGDERTGNVRNLPYHAAMAAAYGLPRDAALRSITLSAAEILGVADRVGSLEAGKDATLIVTTGDPLDVRTQVTAAYVGGREIDLDNKQKQLWRKYEEKYKRLAGEQTPAQQTGE